MTLQQYFTYLLICLPLNLCFVVMGHFGRLNLKQQALLQGIAFVVVNAVVAWGVLVYMVLQPA